MDCPEEGVCSGNAPAILDRGPDGDGWITGTRLYARDVMDAFDRLGSVTAVASATGLTPHQVRVAVEWAERTGSPSAEM